MALIDCPECGQKVSDKATVCIHCGYPLNELVVSNAVTVKENTQVPTELAYPMYLQAIKDSYVSVKCSKCKRTTNFMKGSFVVDGKKCTSKHPIVCPNCANRVEANSIIEIEAFTKPASSSNRTASVVKCPKCGSTQIQLAKKGYGVGKAAAGLVLLGPVGLVGGAIGAADVVRVCMSCKNKF